jgi:hypothetical protein
VGLGSRAKVMRIELANREIDEEKGEMKMETRVRFKNEKWMLGAKLSSCTDWISL